MTNKTPRPRRCAACRYDMSGAPNQICPECGWDTHREHPRVALGESTAFGIVGISSACGGIALLRMASIAIGVHIADEIWWHEEQALIALAVVVAACTASALIARRSRRLLGHLPVWICSALVIAVFVLGGGATLAAMAMSLMGPPPR